MFIDLHVHTSVSPCSRLELADILYHARKRGLDGVCITDHDCMDARFQIKDGILPDGLLVVVGMEYATSQGDFLVFGPFEDLAPGLSAPEMLALVREAGGAAVAAHPCRALRPVDEDLLAQGLVTCVETVNGRNTEQDNRRAAMWPERHGLAATAGSDAHCLTELGLAPTRFSVPVRNRRDLIMALLRGQCAPAVRAPGFPATNAAACF